MSSGSQNATPPGPNTNPGRGETSAFLSPPPRSGELSPFAQKLAAQAFVWLCSIVVFGSTADFATSDQGRCTDLCRVVLAFGVISFVFTSLILLAHYLTWSNKMEKGTWFSSAAEMRYMTFLAMWWIAGAGVLSAVDGTSRLSSSDALAAFTLGRHTSGLAIIFGWLALFGSLYGAYKAFHSKREETERLRQAQILAGQATEEEEYANYS